MTDAEFDDLFRRLSMQKRRACVRKLLAGNDTQCFTKAQYIDAWMRPIKDTAWVKTRYREVMEVEYADMHLRSLPDLVREVRPGVWAAVDGEMGGV